MVTFANQAGPDYLGDIREYSAYQLVYAESNFFRKSAQGEILDRVHSLEEVVSALSTFEGYDPRDVIYAVVALSADARARTKNKSAFMIDEEKEDAAFQHWIDSRPQSPVENQSSQKVCSNPVLPLDFVDF